MKIECHAAGQVDDNAVRRLLEPAGSRSRTPATPAPRAPRPPTPTWCPPTRPAPPPTAPTAHRSPTRSCSGPDQVSQHLTVGTPDANGKGAKSVGYARYGAAARQPGHTG